MKIQLLMLVLSSSTPYWAMAFGETRIIGGQEAAVGKYPYAVSFQDDSFGHFCGGSLIGRDVVLSAAHCVGFFSFDKAVFGRHNLNTNEGVEIAVASTFPHPEYNSTTTDNDFMLVFLDEPADISLELVLLNSDASSPAIGAPVSVAGWGLTDPAASTVSDVLKAVEVNVISNEECDQSEGFVGSFFDSYQDQITENMMCAKDVGEDACQGDSGGPLVLEGSDGSADLQVGVVSWGVGCASPDFPGVYARVSSAYDWIRKEVCEGSLHPPAEFECDDDGTHAPSTVPTKSPTPLTAVPTGSPTPITTVQSTPSNPLCTDTPHWKDSFGDECSWYRTHDLDGCPFHGDGSAGNMGSAKENCCYCGGTDMSKNVSSKPVPTSQTAVSSAGAPALLPGTAETPSLEPRANNNEEEFQLSADKGCRTIDGSKGSNWTGEFELSFNISRETCEMKCVGLEQSCYGYEYSNPFFIRRCEVWTVPIDEFQLEHVNGVDCYMRNGETPEPTSSTTVEPTASSDTLQPTYAPAPAFEASVPIQKTTEPPTTEGEPCDNTPKWVDSDGDGCEWYENSGLPGCPIFGDINVGVMGAASDNCCYCK